MNQIPIVQDFPISRYMTMKASSMKIPLSGGFELTSRCNFNCKMCYVHEMKNPDVLKDQELSVEEWLVIAEEAKKSGMLFLLLTGGEAMLRKDFVELYQKLAIMGFQLSINSNGSMLTEEVIDCFRKYPPARVNISLYGASEDTYEDLCEKRAFRKVKNAIKVLKKEGISVRIVMTLTRWNKQDMEEVFRISKEEETLCVMTSYVFPPIRKANGRIGENKARLSAEEAGRYMVLKDRLLWGDEEFLKRTQNIEYMAKVNDLKESKQGSSIQCQAGRSAFWITWNGIMRPCGLMTGIEADVKKYGFNKAWKKIYEDVQKIRLPIECVTCQNKQLCHGCAAVCQAETGSFDKKPEYICALVASQKEEYRIQREAILRRQRNESTDAISKVE